MNLLELPLYSYYHKSSDRIDIQLFHRKQSLSLASHVLLHHADRQEQKVSGCCNHKSCTNEIPLECNSLFRHQSDARSPLGRQKEKEPKE